MSDLTNIQVNSNEDEIDDIDLEFKKSLLLKKKKKTIKHKEETIEDTSLVKNNDNINISDINNKRSVSEENKI